MKETPLLFKAEMVRATQEGRKTQTRRTRGLEFINTRADQIEAWDHIDDLWVPITKYGEDGQVWADGTIAGEIKCPYGQVGDRLWVRETWCECDGDEGRAIAFKADSWVECPADDGKWRPSIFMPRWASRITLQLTDVRVQRVQDINDHDCYAEGVRTIPSHQRSAFFPRTDIIAQGGTAKERYRTVFAELWNSINEKRGYGWQQNPWVWALSFNVV